MWNRCRRLTFNGVPCLWCVPANQTGPIQLNEQIKMWIERQFLFPSSFSIAILFPFVWLFNAHEPFRLESDGLVGSECLCSVSSKRQRSTRWKKTPANELRRTELYVEKCSENSMECIFLRNWQSDRSEIKMNWTWKTILIAEWECIEAMMILIDVNFIFDFFASTTIGTSQVYFSDRI